MFNKTQSAYVALRNIVSERSNPLVVWMGAGLSKPAGLPMWTELKQVLHSELENKIATLTPDEAKKLISHKAASERAQSPWRALEQLKSGLGQTTYRTILRQAMSNAECVAVPEIYHLVWRLKPSGILNLNIDRLATRAFNEVRPGQVLNEFSSADIGGSTHVLKSPHPFLCNLHGIVSNESSWVFTSKELRILLEDDAYTTFIDACITTRTIVFLGLSVDDIAVGGHLERLKSHNVDYGVSFWITSRQDRKTDDWAERTGIRVIRYNDSNHHAELTECLQDMLSFVPRDTPSSPVRPSVVVAMSTVPSPQSLAKEEPECIRSVLNSKASKLLAEESADGTAAYERFCSEYARAIHVSWYVSVDPPDNRLFGYQLEQEVDEGAFGRVFRARNHDGDIVAVKILREDVRRNLEMLHSFRRGVRSMNILSTHSLSGMVPYREAWEIPACVVMDFIEGPNLRRAVEQKNIETWQEVLVVATQITDILYRAHQLPERVLHRDLRPENIMLRDYYLTPDNLDVVLLDFDLSWHRDAVGKSVCHPSTVSGYLAPEQTQRDGRVSTRNALVDSYGLGMTLYFMRTGQDPSPGITRDVQEWTAEVLRGLVSYRCVGWLSIPRRYARLIATATRYQQSERWDVAQIYGELQRLSEAEANPQSVQSAELVAEELASRAGLQYTWNHDHNAAECQLASGVLAIIRGEEIERRVSLSVSWRSTGKEEFKRVSKWIPGAIASATATLRASGWITGPPDRTESHTAVVESHIPVNSATRNLDVTAKSICDAIKKLTFR